MKYQITKSICNNSKDGLKTTRLILNSLSDLDLGKFINELKYLIALTNESRSTIGILKDALALLPPSPKEEGSKK